MDSNRGSSVGAGSSMKLTTFDTHSHGFDLPASIQLSRVNRKLERWERAQEVLDKNRFDREIYQKSVVKKEEKLDTRIKKTKAQEAKVRKEILEQKAEKI